ncbi:MAG: three-Cys-motif partner protein TcmP [Pseudonocardia sp.]
MADPTIWQLEPHTAIKHAIYNLYLDAWLPIILSSWSTATYAEGYAGPGIYEAGEPGSPIHALRRFRNAQREHAHLHGKTLRMLLVEKRRDRVEKLVEQFRGELNDPMPTGEYRDACLHVIVRQGECETTLPELMDDTRAWNDPVLGVLDSFGGGSTQRLLRRFDKATGHEVLLTVDPQHFVRFDTERADAVFGTPAWREIHDLPPDQKRSRVAALLVDAIRGAGFPYVTSFELHSVRGGDLALQFGTRHPLGIEKFKAALWDADPLGGAQFRDPNDPGQMLLDIGYEPNLVPLREQLLAYLNSQPGHTATLEQLRAYANDHTIFKRSHVPPALELLRQRAAIATSPRQSQIRSQTSKNVAVTATGAEQDDLFGHLR